MLIEVNESGYSMKVSIKFEPNLWLENLQFFEYSRGSLSKRVEKEFGIITIFVCDSVSSSPLPRDNFGVVFGEKTSFW